MLESLRLPPGAAWDRQAMTEALLRLRALEARGARIFYGHDPRFWRTLPQAPTAIA
jgi:glyoxylase-like metal-dependent hydrolase (beta-lactamase superfamily II)